MLAFKNTIKNKTEAVALAKFHYDADNFRQGKFWGNGKGCSVGCMVHDYKKTHDIDWHKSTEPLYGIPQSLSRMQDRIFEGLPKQDAKEWTVRFFKSIPAGADLSMVIPKFLYWILTDEEGIRKHARPNGLKAIIRVSELFDRKIKGYEPKIEEWQEARAAAYAAAYDADAAAADAAYTAYDAAAYAAAYDADAYDAAYDAAAADAAADAAYAAAYDAAYDADAAADAKQQYFKRMSDALIDIIKTA